MFEKYLAEAKKVYEFKVGVAGELPEGFADKLETVLQKFSVQSMDNGKKTPIQERPLYFPQLQNMETTFFEVALSYPTTEQVLQDYVSVSTGVPQSHIVVKNANAPQEEYQEPKNDEPYEAKLGVEEMEQADPEAQDHVAGNRVMDLLKELETARSERGMDPADGAPKGESKDIGDAENVKSTIGS